MRVEVTPLVPARGKDLEDGRYGYGGDAEDGRASDSESEASRSGTDADGPASRCLGALPLCCCCCLLAVLLLPMLIKTCMSYKVGRCTAAPTNDLARVLPASHELITDPWQGLRSLLLWRESEVFDPAVSNTSRIGVWRDSSWFDLYTTFEFVYGEETLATASPTFFKLAFGKEFTLEVCGSSSPKIRITEDWWAEPWFQFLSKTEIFNIYLGDTLVGRANQGYSWKGWEPASWSAVIQDPTGVDLALMSQQYDGWFLASSHWSVVNTRPDLLPTVIPSFLAAVYDLDGGRSSSSSSSRRSSGSRRR